MSETTISREYVQTTGSVIRAGRRLQRYLESDPSKVEFAVAALESAAGEHGSKSAGYHAFLFNSIETAAPAVVQQSTEDALASILIDMQTANVLIAAGQARGETGAKGDRHALEQALQHLEDTQVSVERAQSTGAAPGRFGFAGEPTAPPASFTPESFTEFAGKTLHGFVSEAQSVVVATVQGLDKLGARKIGDALESIARQTTALQGLGRLFSQGLAKLCAAINSLLRLLGPNALDAVWDRVVKIWQDLKDGKLVTGVLEWAFALEATQELLKTTLAAPGLKPEALATAGTELSALQVRFRDTMALARRLCNGVGIATGVLAVTPLAAQGAAALAGAYALILGAVVLIGMDYADSGRILNHVRGVGQIVAGLRPTAAAAGTTA